MAYQKIRVVDYDTTIDAQLLNGMQDAIVALEGRMTEEEQNGGAAVTALREQAQNHMASRVNPHGVTAEQIGASPVGHAHTPASLGAAAADHAHTPASLGAATADHTHTPASLGAEPAIHMLPVNRGGTNADTPAAARVNLQAQKQVTASTVDLTPGESALADGEVYLVYE